MTPLAFAVRPLTTAHAGAMLELQNTCYNHNPACFTSTQDQLADHLSHLDSDPKQLNVVFGAFSDDAPPSPDNFLGLVGMTHYGCALRRHKAHIWGLSVIPKSRRKGVGKALCEALVLHARTLTSIEKLTLTLTGEAVAALHLCRGLGFRIEGVEPMSMKLEGRYLDEIRMALVL